MIAKILAAMFVFGIPAVMVPWMIFEYWRDGRLGRDANGDLLPGWVMDFDGPCRLISDESRIDPYEADLMRRLAALPPLRERQMANWYSGLDDPKEGLYCIQNMENGEWTMQSFDVAWFDGKRWRSTVDGEILPTPFFYCKAKFWGEIMESYYGIKQS